jgi:hypothetical protein
MKRRSWKPKERQTPPSLERFPIFSWCRLTTKHVKQWRWRCGRRSRENASKANMREVTFTDLEGDE